MSDLTKLEDIQRFLREDCVPEALRALKGLLEGEDPKAADIKLAISLAREFGVTFESSQPKPVEGLKLLQGFNRDDKESPQVASGAL